jgi:hypothetical protein
VDDAAGGQRGTRAIVTPDLEEFLRAHWGVRPAGAAADLGGSANLNLLVTDGRSLRVARVYRPIVTGRRVAALQGVARVRPGQARARPGIRWGLPAPGRVDCRSVQFLQPGMLPSGSQLSGVFLAITVMIRVTGLPVLA